MGINHITNAAKTVISIACFLWQGHMLIICVLFFRYETQFF